MAQRVKNPTNIHEDVGLTPGLGIGNTCGLDPVLLWLWCRPAVAALIGPASLETSICHRYSPKKRKKKKKNFAFMVFNGIRAEINSFPPLEKLFHVITIQKKI